MGRSTKEEYAKHYREYQGTPEQIHKRSLRNQARRKMIAAGKAHVGDGKDVHHGIPLSAGGSNASGNLHVKSRSINRGHGRGGPK